MEKITPTAQQMASMLNEYFASGPNCWPHLWIEDESFNWDDKSQKLFIALAIQIKNHR